jgi:hypothetical protein
MAAAAAFLAAAPMASAMTANLLTNGGFESDATFSPTSGLRNRTFAQVQAGDWNVYDAIDGWAAGTGDAGIELQGPGVGGVNAYEGLIKVELDSDGQTDTNSSMSQTLHGLAAGDYALSFAYAPRTTNTADNGVFYDVDGVNAGSLVAGLVDYNGTSGTNAGSVDPNPPTTLSWSIVTTFFTLASADDVTVTFSADGPDNTLGGYIDAVHLSQVPLPAPALMLLGGLAGFGFFRKRRAA